MGKDGNAPSPSRENSIQARIRLAVGKLRDVRLFRNNRGFAYQGSVVLQTQDQIILKNYRKMEFGLVNGASDLLGWSSVIVTPDMVGRRVAIFTAVEVKQPGKDMQPEQKQFVRAVREAGGRAGMAVNDWQALDIVEGRT